MSYHDLPLGYLFYDVPSGAMQIYYYLHLLVAL